MSKIVHYLYHGTTAIALEGIREIGLVPQIWSRPTQGPLADLTAHRPDRISWATRSLEIAIKVADQCFRQTGSAPVVLRLVDDRRGEWEDVAIDDLAPWGDRLWTGEVISPDRLEAMTADRGWEAL
jgi:hypothetical protein